MELRHLRCFLAVASELHFARAAEKLHMDQSPLSRAIKELESDMGAQLFVRTSRSTRLTSAGIALLDQAPKLFALLDQARVCVRAAATGHAGQLRIALSEGFSTQRLAEVISLTKLEEPGTSLVFEEIPLQQQIKGLKDGLYECGFCLSGGAGEGLEAELAWADPLHVALPVGHPLLGYSEIMLEDVLRYPILFGHAETCAGYNRQVEGLFDQAGLKPIVAGRIISVPLMMSLVSTGYAIAILGAAQIPLSSDTVVMSRPLAGDGAQLGTYLLRPARSVTPILGRFMERMRRVRLEPTSQHPQPQVPSSSPW